MAHARSFRLMAGPNCMSSMLCPHNVPQSCVAVACGKDYTLALEKGGRVLAFGADDYGQLGVVSVPMVGRGPGRVLILFY